VFFFSLCTSFIGGLQRAGAYTVPELPATKELRIMLVDDKSLALIVWSVYGLNVLTRRSQRSSATVCCLLRFLLSGFQNLERAH